jgi:hypothetical protein
MYLPLEAARIHSFFTSLTEFSFVAFSSICSCSTHSPCSAFPRHDRSGILASADRVRKRMGETGIRIMMLIMGLMLTAIAVQFVINGPARMNIINVSPQ